MSQSAAEEQFVVRVAEAQNRLYAFILSLVADRDLAGDILQETNVVLWRERDAFAPGTNFTAWSMQIAYNRVLASRQSRHRSRLRFDSQLLELLADEVAQDAPELDRRQQMLASCLDKLDERQRDLINARYRQGESVADLAARFDVQPNTLAKALHRIRMALLQCIQKSLAEESA